MQTGGGGVESNVQSLRFAEAFTERVRFRRLVNESTPIEFVKNCCRVHRKIESSRFQRLVSCHPSCGRCQTQILTHSRSNRSRFRKNPDSSITKRQLSKFNCASFLAADDAFGRCAPPWTLWVTLAECALALPAGSQNASQLWRHERATDEKATSLRACFSGMYPEKHNLRE